MTLRPPTENENLRAALKLCAIIIEMKAPTTLEGVLNKPWDELLEHINATLDGKMTKPRFEVLRRFMRPNGEIRNSNQEDGR